MLEATSSEAKRRKEQLFGLALVIVPSAVIYLRTILPGMGYSGDTAKFQYMGKILGIPHAPGYPLYVLLSRLFLFLPLKSIAFRVNLMSLFFSVLTLILLHLLLLRLGTSVYVAAGTTLALAFVTTYWTQSLVAEVYTLNSFLLALIIFFLVKWQQTGEACFFHLAILFLGLSLAHHMTLMLLVPAVLLFALLVQPKQLLVFQTWLVALEFTGWPSALFLSFPQDLAKGFIRGAASKKLTRPFKSNDGPAIPVRPFFFFLERSYS